MDTGGCTPTSRPRRGNLARLVDALGRCLIDLGQRAATGHHRAHSDGGRVLRDATRLDEMQSLTEVHGAIARG